MRIFLAITAYNGIAPECAESLLVNTHILRDSGYTVMPYFHIGDCFVARARNICVHKFLETDCTDLIFIDSDVAFEKNALSKLMRHDKDIVAGAYPYRKQAEQYPVILKFDEVTRNCLEAATGLVTVETAPAGFMRIQRRVFEKLKENTAYDKNGIYYFFDTGMVFKDDNNWYGEDVVFCKRWTAVGGEIFIAPDIDFTHIGMQKFTGNYHKFLSNGG